ncbi:hypothetical protein [Ramlibacter sp.]|uniref:hypothetical protein n=1 Tax=Ramlibacter sp. TaxID=1917967 RepID=UPI003D0F6908
MRYFSIFSDKASPDQPVEPKRLDASGEPERWRTQLPPASSARAGEPPDDLDQRVRLVGEW